MTLFLTHVPKTAGTSMRKAVFEPSISESGIHSFSGIRRALTRRVEFDLLAGHYPYGVHKLYEVDTPQYFVMLRDPIDRAISQYYFTKMADTDWYSHPDLEDVKTNDLTDFYRTPTRQNLQARYVAGLEWEWVGRHISLNGLLESLVLKRAKGNLLQAYEAFGLKERFQESARLFGSRLGAVPELPDKRHKKTRERPSKDDLSDAVLHQLRELNSLDIALYECAQAHFDTQK